jgi:hypothetical protein
MSEIWVRQKISGKVRPWHRLHDDGRGLWCRPSVQVKTQRTEYRLNPDLDLTEGRVCVRCREHTARQMPPWMGLERLDWGSVMEASKSLQK